LKKYRGHVGISEEKLDLKYKMYSAHDTTISPILQTLGFLDRDCIINQASFLTDFKCKGISSKPPVGSSVTWELIEVGKFEHYVRTNLNGEYINFCNLKPSEMRNVD
jgi:hypothetical protein